MSELIEQLTALHKNRIELEYLDQRSHELRMTIMQQENSLAKQMADQEAYILQHAIAIKPLAEENRIEFYRIAIPLEDSWERFGLRVYSVESGLVLVDILSSKYSRLENVPLDLIQRDLPGYLPIIGDLIYADVSQNVGDELPKFQNFSVELVEDPAKFARDIIRIVSVSESLVGVIIPGFSLYKVVHLLTKDIQRDLPAYIPKAGDRLIAEVLQGVQSPADLIVKNFSAVINQSAAIDLAELTSPKDEL